MNSWGKPYPLSRLKKALAPDGNKKNSKRKRQEVGRKIFRGAEVRLTRNQEDRGGGWVVPGLEGATGNQINSRPEQKSGGRKRQVREFGRHERRL